MCEKAVSYPGNTGPQDWSSNTSEFCRSTIHSVSGTGYVQTRKLALTRSLSLYISPFWFFIINYFILSFFFFFLSLSLSLSISLLPSLSLSFSLALYLSGVSLVYLSSVSLVYLSMHASKGRHPHHCNPETMKVTQHERAIPHTLSRAQNPGNLKGRFAMSASALDARTQFITTPRDEPAKPAEKREFVNIEA